MKAHLFPLLLFLFLFSCMAFQDQPVHSPPNVLYIFPDQFRQYSLGFWSQGDNARHIQGNPDPVITPTLDRLANEGIVLSRAVSNFPLCSPYRAMLLSGMYPDQNGVTNNCRTGRDVQLKTDAQCLTDVFAQAGYETAYVGKCHWLKTEPLFDEEGNYVGTSEAPGGHFTNLYDTYIPPGPDRHSIGYFFQLLNDRHFDPKCYASDPFLVNGQAEGEVYRPKRFSAELEAAAITDYLANTRGQRDPNKPFCLIWSLNPPHNPWTKKSTYMAFYDAYTDSGRVDYKKLLTRENADSAAGHYAPYYFANVSAVDYFIGQVMQELEDQGLAQNTIVVFSSDHGEMLGSHGLTGKNIPEIEAFSIPFFIKWPEKLSHRVADLILSVPDIMPTLLGLAGLSDNIPQAVQGVDYSERLITPEAASVPKPASALFINGSARGVYTGKYMLVVNEQDGKYKDAFCYDNEQDPYQLHRIPFEQLDAQTGRQLKRELKALLKKTNDKWYQEGICATFLMENP